MAGAGLQKIIECIRIISKSDLVSITNIVTCMTRRMDEHFIDERGHPPPKLSENVLELEKDFQFNLILLKSRDAEIARLKKQNEAYCHQIKQKDSEIFTIQSLYNQLESQLRTSNADRERIRSNYKESINRLLHNLEELKNKQEACRREQQLQEKKREAQWKKLLEAAEQAKEKELKEINDWLHKERCLTKKLQSQIEELIKENISLRTQYRTEQSQNISKISILEAEIKAKEEQKCELEMRLDVSKKNCNYFATKFKRTITEMDLVRKELNESDTFKKKSAVQLSETMIEKDNLNQQLIAAKKELQNYIEKLEVIKKDRDKFKEELEKCKDATKHICTDPSHKNIDQVIQQNVVLQKVVKSMRQERSASGEMEKKVQKLESLVEILKSTMMQNCQMGDRAFI